MRFIGLGGTDEIGASCYLYELGGARLLIDAGLRPSLQGEAGLPELAQLAEHPPDLLVLTHAHLDHIGALPVIKRRFPQLLVYATRATKRLALEVLADAVKVGESQGVLSYTLGEAVEAVARIEVITPTEPLAFPGGQLTPYPAGHLLGAVGLLLETAEGKLFHTGDFSNIAGLTTDPAYRPPSPVAVAAVVSEATYGDTTLPNRKEQVRELIATLRTVLGQGGRVLIPTFALGRAQELILLLANHQAGGLLPPVPLYLDGLVRALTAAYQELLPELPAQLRSFAQNSNSSPFYRPNVELVKEQRQRQAIIAADNPAIILASSGMLSGGVSPLYARRILQEERSALLLVGYQDAESPGRRLLELERGGEVLLPSAEGYEAVPALCHLARYYLSAHADRPGITAHLSRYPSQRVVLVHGESNARHGLLEALKAERQVDLPKNGEWVELLAPSSFTSFRTASFTSFTSFRTASFSRFKPTPQSEAPAKPADVSKLRRFKTEAALAVSGNRLTLTFSDEVDLKHLFPDGCYSMTVLKGAITKAELKQRTQPAVPPAPQLSGGALLQPDAASPQPLSSACGAKR